MPAGQCANLNKVVPQDGELFTPYLVNCVIMSVLSVTAVMGNVLILVSICRAPRFLRQPSYFLLINLAFADLCVGFVAEPLYLIYKISYLLNPLSEMSCYAGNVFNIFSFLLTSLSLWTAAVISLDRLMALHLHMKYNAIVTKQRVVVLIVVLLVLSVAFASMFEWALDEQNTVLACANSLALVIALLSYIRIFQIVCYHQRQISSHRVGEISSFTDRDELDSMATSFHEQEVSGKKPKGVSKEIGGNRGKVVPSNNKQMEVKGKEGKQNSAGKNHIEDCKQSSIVSNENRGCLSSNEDLEYQQLDSQMKIVEAINQRQEKKQRRTVGNTSSQLVEKAQGYPHFDPSNFTNATRKPKSALKILDQKGEKITPWERGEENIELVRVEVKEGIERGEISCEPSQENPTEMKVSKTLLEDQNTVINKQPQREICVLEERQTEIGSSEDKVNFKGFEQSKNNILTAEATSIRQKTQTIAKSVTIVDHDRVNTSMEATNDNYITNRRKPFRMRHFKKSFYNMFVIWFLMLLCYLPGICTSILFMLMGRSYSMHLAFNFTTSVMFMNSSINPILFCWRIREFRAAVKKTLKELFGL